MRKIPALFALTTLALVVPAALAQVSGSVTVGGITSDVKGDNPWRFHEYRDLDDGILLGLDVGARFGPWYHNLFAENLGRDDMYANLKGGRYGVFKYSIYADDVIHNWTFGAITPFSGVGTNNLTLAGPNPSTNLATWNRFDYGIQHKNRGGFAEATPTPDSPFYVRVTTNRKRTEGLRPVGQALGSPGGPVLEMPLPIAWTQTDVSGEVGYSSRTMHVSASYLLSKFRDDNDFLFWRHPLVATGPSTDFSTISSDNELKRLAVNAVFRKLPLGSTLALRGTKTTIENSLPVATSWLSVSGSTGALRLANPSDTHFEGEIENTSFSAALNSSLARGIDSKLYYNYYKRDNNSHHIVFLPSGPGSGGGCDFTSPAGVAITPTRCTTEFLHFEKKNLGLEVGWRFARDNRITAGIDYTDTERERVDFDEAKETKYSLDWKSGMFGDVGTRVKYTHMKRESHFLRGNYGNLFERYTYRFDAAPLDRDQLKVTLDYSPMPLLDLGADFIYKKNDYKEVVFGRDKDSRGEVSLSASYGSADTLRVTGFFDYEKVRYDSNHWVGSITTFPNAAPPSAYPWSANVRDKNYLFGVAADWQALPRLKVSGSFIWQQTDGTVDFESFNNLGNPQPITNFENVKKRTLNVKGTYGVTKAVDVTLGAAYERYNVDDIQYNNYLNAVRTGTNQNYYTGAYAFTSYRASIVYVRVTYRF
jgi:MtrB/PioB family decaheme-associated outer membrane protein